MLKITRVGLAAALFLGSASLAFAQTYEVSPGIETGQPNSAGIYRGPDTDRVAPRTGRHHVQRALPGSEQPWSSSFDPGNTGGGG